MKPTYFSWENMAWLNFGKTVTSFAGSALPGKVHFSISYHPDSDYINLHVTKNEGSQTDKPKIEILKVKKDEAEALFQVFMHGWWQTTLCPFDMRAYQSRRSVAARNARFLSFGRFQRSKEYKILKKEMERTFRRHTTMQGNRRRMKMNAAIEAAFTQLARTVPIHNLLACQFKRVPRRFTSASDIGFMMSGAYTGPLLCVNHQWYSFRKEVDVTDFLSACMPTDLVAEIIDKFQTAILIVAAAETYAQTEPHNDPIILYVEKP
jgi:hypothetical protein